MTSVRSSELEDQAIQELGPGSYTVSRLASSCQHATPQHIYLTTRRSFIGPIPEGWLKSHRKSWYKQSLNLSNYSSRAVTFSASFSGSHLTQSSGRDGPSARPFNASFPQPDNVDEEEDIRKSREAEENEPVALSARELNSRGAVPVHSKGDQGDKQAKLVRGHPATSPSDLRTTSDPASRKDYYIKVATLSPPTPSFFTAKERFESPLNPSAGHVDETTIAGPSNISKGVRSATAPVVGNESGQSLLILGNATQHSSVGEESLLPGERLGSTVSLIPHGQKNAESTRVPAGANASSILPPVPISTGLVRFNIPIDGAHDTVALKSMNAQSNRRRSWRQLGRGRSYLGEIVKIEKMLVRVDSTMRQLFPDYNENDSLKTESRTVDKWREFVVVCRESTEEGYNFSIQMYKSRVIPTIEKSRTSKRVTHEIPLIRKSTRVNLYSSLDKTLVIWVPWKIGTRIYILRTRSAASAVEWYTFLRNSLGWERPSELQVYVPDLSLTLLLEDPFGELEASREAARVSMTDETAIMKSLEAERAVAGIIVKRCMKMLEDSPEWGNVLDAWLKNEKMGLAWKRYDRLEWIHGANEQRMYGTIAMQNSHDLELRPKQHYPTVIKSEDEAFEEPSPVEGFLVRLTSQKGRVKRLGMMFYKRLYFYTHNQYLCYCKPAKASPPPPPKLTLSGDSKVPSAKHIVNHTPLVYAVEPYPITQGEISWLKHGTASSRQKHDQEAFKEAERKVNTLLQAEGYINLSHVVRVQNVHRGSSPVDATLDQGPDVDFHEPVSDTPRDDGKIYQFDDDRTFELVMHNGLIIRLQAYNERTQKEWMTSLEKLVQYWKVRLADEMRAYKRIRQLNLETLNIDEEMESEVGQFAEKWEVTRAEASPELFHMCGISCCRAITMAGVLYRKPTRHSTFLRCGVILSQGQLLIFHGSLRERTGKEIPHIQHERHTSIDLKDCYIYSGLITDSDLLYQNQTFDSNHPGHHALPRVYLEDGWTSHDEDTATCFVIWHGRRKSLFRASEDTAKGGTRRRLRYVSRLGVPGRSIVFKTRSRAERDHWVLNIAMEIDRLQSKEEIRVES